MIKKKDYFLFSSFVLMLFFLIPSCSDNSENEIQTEASSSCSISGKWKLITNQNDPSSDIILELRDNGYFQTSTVIKNQAFIKAGISKIQPISKGQWDQNDNTLELNHLNVENIKTEKFIVKKIDDTSLEIKSKDGKIHKYERQK